MKSRFAVFIYTTLSPWNHNNRVYGLVFEPKPLMYLRNGFNSIYREASFSPSRTRGEVTQKWIPLSFVDWLIPCIDGFRGVDMFATIASYLKKLLLPLQWDRAIRAQRHH